MDLRLVILHEFFAGVILQPVINQMNAIESCLFVFPSFCLCDLAKTLFQLMEGSFHVDWKSLCQSIYWTAVVGSQSDKLEGTDKILP